MAEISMEVRSWLRKRLEEADPDLLREMVSSFVHMLMSAEADALCGADYGERSETRINRRNGYREREFDTRVGTMGLAIPKLRAGSYFPEWLLEPRRRAERALVAVITECYVAGVSTRRVDGLVQTLGIKGISKSQVSEMAKSLDEGVEAFRNRPLDGGPYRYLWLDALTMRCRDGGRIVNVAVVVATAVNTDGHREILGIDVVTTEDGASWTTFLRGLVARGLSGVWLVTSDAHEGLKAGIASVLPGASWQRCRTHFMRNPPHAGTEERPGAGSYARTLYLRPAVRRRGVGAAHPGGRAGLKALPAGRRTAGGGRGGDLGLHSVPEGALSADLVEQPPGAAQQGDPAAD